MTTSNPVSRRKFIEAAAATAAASYVANPAMAFAFGKSSSAAGSVDSTQLPWRDQGVLNLANSPYAKLHSVPVRAVTIEEGFWSKRRETNVKSSIPTMRDQLLGQYQGQWIGFADGTVVAAATTPLEVFLAVQQSGRHPFVVRVGHEGEPWYRIRRTSSILQ